MPQNTTKKRVELHAHLGSSVDPVILWTIAHQRGIKLPSKDYWDFEKMITMAPDERNTTLEEMDSKYFEWTERIQSSPEGLEVAVHSVIGGGYRKCNIVVQELRFNPMRRNRSGERDLDHIILASIRGLQRSLLEYPQVKAGIIFSMDRRFSYGQNEIILQKAIKYAKDGVVGVDIAGPYVAEFSMESHAPLFAEAKSAGLGVTIHTGEEGSIDEMRYVVSTIKPNRIGHGILAAKDPDFLGELRESGITLELCPTSNLKNSILKDVSELRATIRAFADSGVKFTINTDGPEMYQSNLAEEEAFLLKENILSQAEIDQATAWAFDATFVRS
ncbi:adenosine deaminase [Patescibacteria group bacterium]|nr:MAG: adenosine deaminase [Patescibacteria group bacterium]